MIKKRMLIIEDDMNIRVLLETYFKNNYQVKAIGNATEALNHIIKMRQTGTYEDIVIADHYLSHPEITGSMLLRQISEKYEKKPILILMSGEIRTTEYKFIKKPFNIFDLEKLINE